MLDKLKENDDLYDMYQSGNNHLRTLSELYEKVKLVFDDQMTEKKKIKICTIKLGVFCSRNLSIQSKKDLYQCSKTE